MDNDSHSPGELAWKSMIDTGVSMYGNAAGTIILAAICKFCEEGQAAVQEITQKEKEQEMAGERHDDVLIQGNDEEYIPKAIT